MDHYAEQLAILPEFLHFRTNKLRQCCFPNKSGAEPAILQCSNIRLLRLVTLFHDKNYSNDVAVTAIAKSKASHWQLETINECNEIVWFGGLINVPT